MNLFDLVAVLTINKSDYDKGLDDAEKKASKFSVNIPKPFKAAGKAITTTYKTMFKSFEMLGSAAIKAGKLIGAGTAAAAGVAVKVGKAALDAYANYEQLVGGVDTLFKESSGKVQAYADNAFKTAGMSANEYMELVTSFSASLLQAVGGDTAKAADIADQAIIDMSDNANKMGSDIESIKTAYSGFAKQNYTMLDNLKLGYGGTKDEMERLIRDAEKLDKTFSVTHKKTKKGVDEITYSYADIIQAIHIVQTDLGITGTTAKEASTTIQGSIASMKSAWQNLLVGIADDSQPFDKLVDNFVESIDTVGDNILPRVEQIIVGIGKLVEKVVPKIVQRIPGFIQETAPALFSAVTSLAGTVMDAILSLLDMLANFLANNSGRIIKALLNFVTAVVALLPKIVQPLLKALPKIIKDIAYALMDNIPVIMKSLSDVFVMIAQELPTIIDALIDVLPELINTYMDAVIENLPIIIMALTKLVGEIVERLPQIIAALLAALPKIVESVLVGLGSLAAGIFEIFENIDLTEVIGGIVDSIGEVFATIGEVLAEPFEAIEAFFEGVWEFVEDVMNWIWDKVSGVFKDIRDFIDWINPFSDDGTEEHKKDTAALRAAGNYYTAEEMASGAAYMDARKYNSPEKLDIGGTVRVEGVNDQGQFIGVADYTMNQITKQLERDARLGYAYGGG